MVVFPTLGLASLSGKRPLLLDLLSPRAAGPVGLRASDQLRHSLGHPVTPHNHTITFGVRLWGGVVPRNTLMGFPQEFPEVGRVAPRNTRRGGVALGNSPSSQEAT